MAVYISPVMSMYLWIVRTLVLGSKVMNTHTCSHVGLHVRGACSSPIPKILRQEHNLRKWEDISDVSSNVDLRFWKIKSSIF